MTTEQHNYQLGATSCDHPRCQKADGWQCEECGHYFPRNQITDDHGAYYCREGKGHNR
jgi:hypothetical protein